jgi:hypothetical protein
MRDVTHDRSPHDSRAFHWFARGPLIAADGGRPDDANESEDRDIKDEQLRDVSHEPTHGEGANRVWDRGDEDEDG